MKARKDLTENLNTRMSRRQGLIQHGPRVTTSQRRDDDDFVRKILRGDKITYGPNITGMS